MSTARLLWNCAWRTTIWSVGLGTGLGAIYGGFVVVISMLITTVLYARMGALSVNPLLAAPAGMLFVVPFGIIVGAILGIAAGTLLGVLEGLLLCALTYFFLKTENAVAYRRSARISGAILSVAILVTAWALLGFKPNAFAGGGGPPGAFSGIGVADVLLLEIGPIIVVAGAAQFANKKVADWCIANVLGAEDRDSGIPNGTDF